MQFISDAYNIILECETYADSAHDAALLPGETGQVQVEAPRGILRRHRGAQLQLDAAAAGVCTADGETVDRSSRLPVQLVLIGETAVEVPFLPLHRVSRADAQHFADQRVEVVAAFRVEARTVPSIIVELSENVHCVAVFEGYFPAGADMRAMRRPYFTFMRERK